MTAHYATLVCGRAAGDAVEICNAGHCPVLVLRRDAIQRLDSTGLPLGLFCATEYPVTRLGLGQGDSLVLYSDGVTETQDPAGHDFGADRLGQSLRRQANGDLRAMAQAVASDLTQFRAGLRQADDVTLLIVRRRGSPSGL
jgi:sigma-B regulation protein RsbU (phosphoserine phosphatase)